MPQNRQPNPDDAIQALISGIKFHAEKAEETAETDYQVANMHAGMALTLAQAYRLVMHSPLVPLGAVAAKKAG